MPDLTPDQVLQFFNNLDPAQANNFFQKLVEGSNQAREAMGRLVGATQQVTTVSESLKMVGEIAVQKFEQLANTNVGDLVQGLNAANRELLAMTAQSFLLAGVMGSGIKPDAFNNLAAAAGDASSATGDIGEAIKKIPGVNNEIISSFFSLAEPARKLEASILAMAASSGELGEVLREVGSDLSGLEQKSVTFARLTYDIANAAGLTTSQVAKYAAELNKIPGALSSMIETSITGSEQMHVLDAAIKVASGTGQGFSVVVEDMNRVFREFGTTGQDALEYVARLSAASQGLKLPLDLVKDYTTSAAQSFRFFGDNSQAALNILAKFGPALKESGLGPKAIADLTQNVTRNIAEMGAAQRAFVSGTAGGVGGLQGAFQIELLKRQGKLDEVQKMVEDSLRKQFGGRIVTLEEASQDAGSAAQFTKQVQLLTQGPTKIAGSESEAYAILEAMARGTRAPATGEVASKEEALEQALDVGNSFQERNYNELVAIANKIDLGVQFSSIIANNTSRNILGPEANLTNIMNRRTEGSEAAAERKLIVGESTAPEETVSETILTSLKAMGSFQDQVDRLNNTFQDFISNVLSPKMDELSGSVVNPKQIIKDAEPAPSPLSRISNTITTEPIANAASRADAQGISTLEVNNVTTCPICQKKEMTRTAEVIFSGKIQDFRKGEVNHVHTGANIGT